MNWDERYDRDDYIYGTEPNEFLADMTEHIPSGRVLSLADGEGRNSVYLATRGYDVTSVDSSRVGVEKAHRLADERGVTVNAIVADLADYAIEPRAWQGIVSVFCHLPKELRAQVHAAVVSGLAPGGVFVLEAYTPRQLEYGTGGPPTVELLVPLAELREELSGLEFEVARELERDVHEGSYHSGRGHVVQVVARKPGHASGDH